MLKCLLSCTTVTLEASRHFILGLASHIVFLGSFMAKAAIPHYK